MSKEISIKSCKDLIGGLSVMRVRKEGSAQVFNEFNGLAPQECEKEIRFIQEVFRGIDENNAWEDISWHALQSLASLLQNVSNSYFQFDSVRDQGSFQNFAASLDGLAYHIRMFGIVFLSLGGSNMERISAALSEEMNKMVEARIEVEQLRRDVKALVEPAVAGSLSQSFTARKKVLFRTRLVWGAILFGVAFFCVFYTHDFVVGVSEALASSKDQDGKMWSSVFIRSIILLPLYVAFGFSFSQYKKERDFEEEYAHKAAVATSLPNYGDLTREPAIRDQIVTGATNVIFSSPIAKNSESDKQDKVLGGIKEVFDSLAKLVPKKD